MKIFKGTAFLVVAMLCFFGTTSAADRLVLGELYTSTTCPPCRAANLELDDLAIELEPILVIIRYHGWWPSPGNDPFYHYNVSQNTARFNYYGVNSVPNLRIDGYINAGYNYPAWRGMIESEAENSSPLIMNISGSYDEDARAGEFTVSIYAEMDPGASNLKLRIALTESNIYYQAPNGLTIHHQTFRHMYPGTSGQSFTISEGETVDFTFDLTTPDPLVPRGCRLVAFVQSDQNRQVLQSAKAVVVNLEPTGIEDEIEIPESIALGQNYPNPFNAETKIDFQTNGGAVSLEIYDLTGAMVRTLIDGSLEAGHYSATWNGLDESGNDAASGVYFYRLNGADGELVKRMTLLK